MREPSQIYDLGSLDPSPRQQATADPRSDGTTPLKAATLRRAGSAHAGFDITGTLSLFIPGSGQIVRGEFALGLFFLSWIGFLAVLGWALIDTLERVTGTLRVLGYPGAPGVWALTAIYVCIGLFHISAILESDPRSAVLPAPPPVVAGIASGLVPGWGQVLNGSFKRAALLVAALWLIGATWILAAPAVHDYLATVRLFIPPEVLRFCSPAVRFTAPAVLWALAVYDAAATAASRR